MRIILRKLRVVHCRLTNTTDSQSYPWSVARTDNSITRYRAQVIESLLQSLCHLPLVARERVRGITLLGEVHQLFPNFESGMGFGGPYQVSDYSATSVAGFRQYLRDRYTDIAELNERLGSDYPSFEAVDPPSKDIRREPLQRYQEHMDAFAAGTIPVTGWTHVPGAPGARESVAVYLDGKRIGTALVHLESTGRARCATGIRYRRRRLAL